MTDAFGSAEIAGYEAPDGSWVNVEAGEGEPTADELEVSGTIVIAVTDDDGERHYYTTSYLTDDYGIDEFLADREADYGTQFV